MIYLISTRHLYLATLPLPCSSLCCFILTFSKKKFKIMTWMHGHCHYDRVLSWSGAKQHSRRETPLLKSLHKKWCNAPRNCTRHQGVEQFFAPGAEWYPSLAKCAFDWRLQFQSLHSSFVEFAPFECADHSAPPTLFMLENSG